MIDWLDDLMPAAVEWFDHRVIDGVAERSFHVVRTSGDVPGVLWLPSCCSTPRPLVLLGHGGSGHKRSGRIVELARWFATYAGLAAVAIDGPYHGDRVSSPLSAAQYQARIAETGIEVVLDRMAEDWRATVDAIAAMGLADPDRLAYVGMSMGARFGLSVAAAMGDRFRCLVFGKFGLQQGSAMNEGMAAPERVASDARRITAPVLFHVQWHDELFPRHGQLALFDLLGSTGKQLVSYVGTHAETDPGAIALWRDFISRHLALVS
ncbi:dienelactone hydrolase family protein [Micromonospora sp. NBRC 110038]|uniref:dienelactone hydrolase family protein n=1 Tax=Micromonospora sp. NBRC 110038 TaxID=1550034 RepID=UPI001E2BEEC2|nr:dienelactone hydrolase family protein [Micromonospora sp. NBRC 110038]